MSNTDNLRKMYSAVNAPEDAVRACLDIPERAKKTANFPIKRAILIAACLIIVLAVAIPVGANRIRSAFEVTEDYGKQYPLKVTPYYSNIDSESLIVSSGDKTTSSAEGLQISVEKVYYDGSFVYLSFAGDYSGEYTDIDRFFCGDTQGFVTIDGEPQKADLTNYSFCLFESDGTFGGVMGFIYPYDKEELSIQVEIPYLQVWDKETQEVKGVIDEEFSLSFKAKKSAPSLLVYNAESSKEEVSVLGVTSSQGGICVEIFVPQEISDKKAGVVSVVEEQDGSTLGFILGNRENTEEGAILRQYFEPAESDAISIYVYDKNDTDGCGNSPCFLTSFEDISIKISE